jgi:tripartite-type tricarboxylate transporter receptor subunit TctC
VPSSGTIPHFTGWQLEQVLGLSMTRVPYRGSCSTPEGLTKALAADTAFWQPIVKATGYKITN